MFCSVALRFRHLYLEQTWIGTDVRNLLKCVNSLVEVDSIAFRVVHQLANVLEGVRLDSVATELQYDDDGSSGADDHKTGAGSGGASDGGVQRKPREFDRALGSDAHSGGHGSHGSGGAHSNAVVTIPWQEYPPGRELHTCAALEYNKFNRRGAPTAGGITLSHDFQIDSLKSAILSLPKDKAQRRDWFDGLRVMQLNYWRDVYGITTESKLDAVNEEKQKSAEAERFAQELESELDSMLCLLLILSC